jgi:hypothetical protein
VTTAFVFAEDGDDNLRALFRIWCLFGVCFSNPTVRPIQNPERLENGLMPLLSLRSDRDGVISITCGDRGFESPPLRQSFCFNSLQYFGVYWGILSQPQVIEGTWRSR